jgi:hypothetical protein
MPMKTMSDDGLDQARTDETLDAAVLQRRGVATKCCEDCENSDAVGLPSRYAPDNRQESLVGF